MNEYRKIILPTRPQPDTIIAVFILQLLGREKFPGIQDAEFEVSPVLPAGETPESLEAKGTVVVDVGGGSLDHHAAKTKTTASKLVAEHLGVASDPALTKLLAFAERDDFYGKGTVSNDPLDRAFGLSGLVVNLNRSNDKDPVKVFKLIIPIIAAHYEEESRRTKEMPQEFEERRKAGEVETFSVKQRGNTLKGVIIRSDNVSMPGYLRSQMGGRFDVVVQRKTSGHVNILTRQTKQPEIDGLAALIRMEEAMRAGKELERSEKELRAPGRLTEVPNWYYDPATNSIQNGGGQQPPTTHHPPKPTQH